MPKFFVKPDQVRYPHVNIYGTDVNHISKVLRLKPGDSILITDGTGTEYMAEIAEMDSEAVKALISKIQAVNNEPSVEVYLLQGLPKGEKFDFIVQKCTEIGVRKIIPVNMTRTVVRLTAEKGEKRRERWQRIAAEAAKQCQRGVIPEIDSVKELGQALKSIPKHAVIILPWELEHKQGLKELLNGLSTPGPIVILIGPEGGITSEEVIMAQQYGAKTVSLGPRILRTETAGLVAAALVLYHLGDLGGHLLEQS